MVQSHVTGDWELGQTPFGCSSCGEPRPYPQQPWKQQLPSVAPSGSCHHSTFQCGTRTASAGEDRSEDGPWSVLQQQGSTPGGDDHRRLGPSGGGNCVRDSVGRDDDEAEVCHRGIRLDVHVSSSRTFSLYWNVECVQQLAIYWPQFVP